MRLASDIIHPRPLRVAVTIHGSAALPLPPFRHEGLTITLAHDEERDKTDWI